MLIRVAWGYFPADERWPLDELTRVVSRHVDQDGDLLIRGGSGARNRKLERLHSRLRYAGYETAFGTAGNDGLVLHVARRQRSPS
jgi:hypothetical protein